MKQITACRVALGVLILALPTGLAGGGCSSTGAVSAWQDPESQPRTYRHVMVLGMARREELRRQFEDEFAKYLTADGAQVTQSYRSIDSAVAADREQLRQAVRAAKADAVVITRLVKTETRSSATPVNPAAPAAHGGYYDYYRLAWDTRYTPPLASAEEIVTIETRLYDADSEKLIWTGTTESFDPANTDRLVRGLVQAIAGDLRRRRLV